MERRISSASYLQPVRSKSKQSEIPVVGKADFSALTGVENFGSLEPLLLLNSKFPDIFLVRNAIEMLVEVDAMLDEEEVKDDDE